MAKSKRVNDLARTMLNTAEALDEITEELVKLDEVTLPDTVLVRFLETRSVLKVSAWFMLHKDRYPPALLHEEEEDDVPF